jgi:hypothetical protein
MLAASAADTPVVKIDGKPVTVVPDKPLSPIEMYRNLEAQQAQIQVAATQAQAEYQQHMKQLQSTYDQCEGAKQLLALQNPDLLKQLQAEAEKAKTPKKEEVK